LSSNENPFDHPASHWNLGKPLVIGEFWAAGWDKEAYPAYKVDTKTPEQLYLWAYEQGYAGALAWNFAGDHSSVAPNVKHDYAAAKPGMEALAAKYEQFIKIKDYTPGNTSGNGVMQVTYSNIQSEATLEYQKTFNLTGNSTVTFKARTVGNSPAFSVRLVVKSGSAWDWSQAVEMCDIPAGGAWTTCSYDLPDFTVNAVNVSDVRSFLIQTFNNGYSGIIQFDDFVAGTTVINNFDTQFDTFGVAASMPGGDAITKIETVYLNN
jgi:hypothetical protein